MSFDTTSLRDDGYQLVEAFLTRSEHETLKIACQTLATIRSAREVVQVERFVERFGSNTHTYLNKTDLVPELRGFVASDKITAISRKIFGDAYHAHMNLLQHSVGGRQQGIAWHRDIAFRFGAMQMVNLLFYPLGTDAARGGIRLIPGSHRIAKPDIPGPFERAPDQTTLFPGERDLLLVDGACYHSVQHSQSADDRMSFNIRIRHERAPKEITRWAEFTSGVVDFLPDDNPKPCA